MTRIWEIL